MHFTAISTTAALLLFVGMMVLQEVGRRVGRRRFEKNPEGIRVGAIEGAIFALLGLLIAFTFSGAASRFDDRRRLIVEEANDIGTAWLRIDILPAGEQPALRDLFRKYVDSRIETYRALPDIEAALKEYAHSQDLQGQIWSQATAAALASSNPREAMLLLPAINSMFDIASTRLAAARMHPPLVIYGLLFILSLGCALLAGYAMAESRSRAWIHGLGFAFILAGTFFVILEMEYPRMGVITVDAADQAITDVRSSMK